MPYLPQFRRPQLPQLRSDALNLARDRWFFFCIIFVWVQEAFLDEIEVQPLSIIERAEKEAAAARRAAAAAAEYAKNAFSAAQAAKSGTAKPKDKPVAVEPKATVPKPLIKPTPTSKPAALPASQPTGTAVPLHNMHVARPSTVRAGRHLEFLILVRLYEH